MPVPTKRLKAGPSPKLFVERLDTPTGLLQVVTDDEQQVRAVDWDDHQHRLYGLLARHYGVVELHTTAAATPAGRALDAYFAGDLNALDALPTATNGTAFQRLVWAALRTIPVGRTISYSALAAQIGQPTATRAVGLANGSNPISIVIPCHRVIGANGALTGFGGGVARKRWLLAHENRTLTLEPPRA